MRELLLEQLRHIVLALPAGVTFAQWYYDGCDFDVFEFSDPIQREAVSFAFGYLRGAHEATDCTLLEMLWDHDIDETTLGIAKEPRIRKQRRKADRKVSRG